MTAAPRCWASCLGFPHLPVIIEFSIICLFIPLFRLPSIIPLMNEHDKVLTIFLNNMNSLIMWPIHFSFLSLFFYCACVLGRVLLQFLPSHLHLFYIPSSRCLHSSRCPHLEILQFSRVRFSHGPCFWSIQPGASIPLWQLSISPIS